MRGVREKIDYRLTKPEAEILVEQELHLFGSGNNSSLTVSRVSEASADVVLGQFRKIGEDLRMALTGCEPAEHIRHSNPHMPDTGTAAALPRLDGNDVLVVHGVILAPFQVRCSKVSSAAS
jgi:hypothetical protein